MERLPRFAPINYQKYALNNMSLLRCDHLRVGSAAFTEIPGLHVHVYSFK